MASRVAIVGSGAGAAQAALTLAEIGVPVAIVTSSAALELDGTANIALATPPGELLATWPLLLRATSHPMVSLHTNCDVQDIRGEQGEFTITAVKRPRYVRESLCTACGRCQEVCSIQLPSAISGRKATHSAIHAPVLSGKTVPSAYCIDKKGIAPCRAACPLGIRVQGFVSLLAKGKVDEALSLINEAAPLAGVLGRVCTHPCEEDCKLGEVDSPVFIRALHRYAADNAAGGINYKHKAPAGSRKHKIAIVGSGPAGLTAAWELARCGYLPTIFESHAVVGGMLATGIPRFRLPREVREREVEAIKALGVDIKTGIVVGRDVTISDLKEREYEAFFLAIGAHENNRLNIPGEDLEGVMDGISLLFTLNLKVGVSVGSNIVVVGGGNSAVDSARTAKRQSKGTVRILYRRTAEEMTAVKEDIEEALKEGVLIEYLTAPVEILGDGSRVTGIRCQRMALGTEESDGRRRPEPIPGSEFAIDCDHVVAAIGQRPHASVLHMKGLDIARDDGTITVDPLTLQTNIPGIFAGGDCVTGPNNVVEAVSAGLRGAESIDRYLSGHDLREGRTLEKPRAVEVDISEKEISSHRRALMPAIHHSKRMGTYEETAVGLPGDVAEREAGRCLNCGLCSECMECERVCEVGAVFHKDTAERLEIGAEVVIYFPSDNGAAKRAGLAGSSRTPHLQPARPGIYTAETAGERGLEYELALAAAAALEATAQLKPKEADQKEASTTTRVPAVSSGHARGLSMPTEQKPRVGVILCRCGGSISSVIDLNQVTNEATLLPNVQTVQEVPQVCSEEGARRVAAHATEWELDRVVVAACRCCNLDQTCYSCSDRRVMCQQYLDRSLGSLQSRGLEFVNIREQCAWMHKDDPQAATRNAIEIVSSGVARAREALPAVDEEHPVAQSVFLMGAGLRGLAAAKRLIGRGFPVAVVSGPRSGADRTQDSRDYRRKRDVLVKELSGQGTETRPWPRHLELDGSPGAWRVTLGYGPEAETVEAGVLLADLGELRGQVPAEGGAIAKEGLLGRILAREGWNGAGRNHGLLRGLTIKETGGIFVMPAREDEPPDEQEASGAATAARALAYLRQGAVSPRVSAVSINGRLCRGCGDCAAVCPFIEMRKLSAVTACAYIDRALCLGCGACVAVCPTGAITQPHQSDRQLTSALEALLGKATYEVEAL